MIHADRITRFTCKVDGDKATGVADFEVPTLYQGRVHYAAECVDNNWQITDLEMPGRDIHIVRGDDGKWNPKK